MFGQAGRLSQSCCKKNIVNLQRRSFKSSCRKEKALENWKRPSIDELGIPTESWKKVFDRNQKRFNFYLMAGTGFLGATTIFLSNVVFMNPEPKFLKKTGYVTKNLREEELSTLTSKSSEEVVEAKQMMKKSLKK